MNSIKQQILLILSLTILLFSSAVLSKEAPTTLLVWGDSLSAAYGIPVEKGWVSLFQKKHKNINVINGSISGETTQGGLTRLPKALKLHQPNIVLIELGANDGLRGLSIKTMRTNLTAMIKAIQVSGAKVVLAGMKIPPNYGMKYTEQFTNTYVDLSKTYKTALIPFFLAGIADKFELVQADGLHPTAEAQVIILDNIDALVVQSIAL